MITCESCEYFHKDAQGRVTLSCNPFSTVKEESCIAKWQLLRLDALLQSYQVTLSWYQKLAPLQEKMFKYMKREIDEAEEGDSWKYNEEEEAEPQDNDDDQDKLY